MEEVIKILVKRDNMSYKKAKDLCLYVKKLMEDCNYNIDECEDIFTSEIGLEIDYIPEFLLL